MSNSQDLLTSELEPVFWQLGTPDELLHAGEPPSGIHTDKLLRIDTCFERDGTALNILGCADWCKADWDILDQSLFQVPSCGRHFVHW